MGNFLMSMGTYLEQGPVEISKQILNAFNPKGFVANRPNDSTKIKLGTAGVFNEKQSIRSGRNLSKKGF